MATLVWCANLASLELHPFLHRAANLDCPASMIFDLDPGEGTDLKTCAEVAFLLKALLKNADLECFPKVSGSKGLQLYVPLNALITYAETRSVALAAAQMLEREHPALIVSQMAKERRRGKVFIDWSQNSDFKTTIGVYSLRAKADAPFVSAPVTWAELDTLVDKGEIERLRFSPEALLKRLEKVGDLFAPLLSLKQRVPTDIRKRALPRPAKENLRPLAQRAHPNKGLAKHHQAFLDSLNRCCFYRPSDSPAERIGCTN